MDAIIVGGGLAGLSCAVELLDAEKSFVLLEASDAVGGRVRTDRVEGFLLDRGFQVLLTAYPEARRLLDYESLELRRFEPGALIRHNGRFQRLVDPWRRPKHILSTALSPVATLSDKLKIASLRSDVARTSIDEITDRPEKTTLKAVESRGFSQLIRERFFRPFLGGVFLDSDLETSSRMFEFVFRMFSLGDTAVPSNGMQAIPTQLSERLPHGSIRLESPVSSIDSGQVRLVDGEVLKADNIIIATDAPTCRRLLDDSYPAEGRSVTCHYFAADEPPFREPILILNGDGRGPINNLCVMSEVAPSYSPVGKSLISVSSLRHNSVESGVAEVRTQLEEWFGAEVKLWSHLRSYAIPYALPVQAPPALDPVEKPVEVRPGVLVCGDHCDTGSINGAMASGRRVAEFIVSQTLVT